MQMMITNKSNAATATLHSFLLAAAVLPENETQQLFPRFKNACSISAEASLNETQQFVRSCSFEEYGGDFSRSS